MPNGKPGDHPVTDILVHGMAVYSPEVDELVRRLDRLLGRERLYRLNVDWFDQHSTPELQTALEEAYQAALANAKAWGWEL